MRTYLYYILLYSGLFTSTVRLVFSTSNICFRRLMLHCAFGFSTFLNVGDVLYTCF